MRVPVPDDYERRDVPLPEEASSLDYENMRDVVGDAGRVAQVREDDDGRYVGVPEQYAPGVADYLGVSIDYTDDESKDATAEESDADEDDGEDGLVGGFDPTEHTVDEIRAHVEEINGDRIHEELAAIRDAEAEGKDRTTALDAIDGRLSELEDS